MKTLVVFHGRGATRLAQWFGAPGFRHCFVCVARDGYWLSFDGGTGVPIFEVVCADSFDLAKFYEDQGFRVVAAKCCKNISWWPWMTASCVGAVKKILGLRAPWIQTPLQLYTYLEKET